MRRTWIKAKWIKWGLLAGTTLAAILPASCDQKILRLVTPLLV